MQSTLCRVLTIAAVSLCAPIAIAQDRLKAQSFLPPEYGSEVFLDVKRAADGGLLDAASGILKQFTIDQFEKSWGFSLFDVDRVRAVMEFRGENGHVRSEFLWTIEGKETVGMPTDFGYGEQTELTVGGFDVVSVNGWGTPVWYASPHPGLVVQGEEKFIRPALMRQSRGGRPGPELMTLTARPGCFGHAVVRLNDAMREDLPPFMDASWLTESDPLDFMVVRALEQRSDDDIDSDYKLEAVFRCRHGVGGAAKIEQKVRDSLAQLKQHKQLGALKHVWNSIKVTADDTDVLIELPLGKPRAAVGTLSAAIAPMMMLRAVEAQAQAIQVIGPVQVGKIEAEPEEDEAVVEPPVIRDPVVRPASRPTSRPQRRR